MNRYREQKEALEREAFRRDPEKAYLASREDFDKKLDELGWSPKDLKTMAVMYIDRAEYNMKRNIRLWFRNCSNCCSSPTALVIDTIRTFFLIALSILGPIAFALSVYEGFQSTLTQWITRYISIYMWLPVSDLFSSVLARIRVLMLTGDIEAMSDPSFIPDSSNAVYIIFLIIGIFGYFTIPTVSNWIIMAGGCEPGQPCDEPDRHEDRQRHRRRRRCSRGQYCRTDHQVVRTFPSIRIYES